MRNHTETVSRDAAQEAGLRYVTDTMPGFTRTQSGKHFTYKDTDGKIIKNKAVIDRINALAIPPAYTDVWICPHANGHIQATGRDARGRKQYRYHNTWRTVRDSNKYDKMIPFGNALPKIRRTTRRHLSLPGLPKEKVLATIIQLLDKTHIRVGNEEYATTNHSYGLTTMRVKHVDISGSTVEFTFSGKSGVKHDIQLDDKKLAKIIKQCHDLPGYELFQYVDEDGNRHVIHSEDVNTYIKDISGHDFTAKDFRTWHGTVLACTLLQQVTLPDSVTEAKKEIVSMVEAVAKDLGNTRAVSRKAYIHPAIISAFLDNSLTTTLQAVHKKQVKLPRDLFIHEAHLIEFLKLL